MSSSSKRQKDGNTWWRKLLSPKALLQRVALCRTLDLPLDKFIRCIIHGDLSALVISGVPSESDIGAAWANIYNEYLDLSNDAQVLYILHLQKDICLLTSHCIEVEGALFLLSLMHHDNLVKILKDNGYKYIGDAEIIRNQLAVKRQSLESKQKEYDDYMEAHKNDDINESYFTKALIRLAKYQGVALIRTKDISVREFVVLLSDYIEYVNRDKKELEDA